jgi:hypothetical protein
MHEGDLLEIWHLLTQYGKMDCLAIDLALKQTSQCTGFTHSASIITP